MIIGGGICDLDDIIVVANVGVDVVLVVLVFYDGLLFEIIWLICFGDWFVVLLSGGVCFMFRFVVFVFIFVRILMELVCWVWFVEKFFYRVYLLVGCYIFWFVNWCIDEVDCFCGCCGCVSGLMFLVCYWYLLRLLLCLIWYIGLIMWLLTIGLVCDCCYVVFCVVVHVEDNCF